MSVNDDAARRWAPALHRVRLVDADPTSRDLLGQWLSTLGCSVVPEPASDAESPPAADLVIVDVPFPRQGGVDLVRRVASQHPATPILALSTNFFSGIECCGPVARALGWTAYCPPATARHWPPPCAGAAALRR
jgi:CheY-like chemotaxis protein